MPAILPTSFQRLLLRLLLYFHLSTTMAHLSRAINIQASPPSRIIVYSHVLLLIHLHFHVTLLRYVLNTLLTAFFVTFGPFFLAQLPQSVPHGLVCCSTLHSITWGMYLMIAMKLLPRTTPLCRICRYQDAHTHRTTPNTCGRVSAQKAFVPV